MEKIVQKVNSADPKMVLITGDLLDGMDGNIEGPLEPIKNIKADEGIYFVTGNHETYLGLNEVFSALSKTKIKVLKDQVVDIGGLKLIGINYPSRGEEKNVVSILSSMKKDFLGKPNILMYHSPVNIEQIKNSGINLELCGHTHDGQLFPLNYITKLMYKGYDYGLHQSGNYTLYTTNGAGTWGPAMRTGSASEIVVVTLDKK
jgi:predicted MPP superfamily phosphohydrolase